jgi:hypothetical protein
MNLFWERMQKWDAIHVTQVNDEKDFSKEFTLYSECQ